MSRYKLWRVKRYWALLALSQQGFKSGLRIAHGVLSGGLFETFQLLNRRARNQETQNIRNRTAISNESAMHRHELDLTMNIEI